MPHQLALTAAREGVKTPMMLGSIAAALAGLLISALFFLLRPRWGAAVGRALGPIARAGQRGWFISELYELLFVRGTMGVARASAWIDRVLVDGLVNGFGQVTVGFSRVIGWFDHFVVDGLVSLVGATAQFFGLMVRMLQTGRVQSYLSWLVAGVIVLLVVIRYVVPALP